MTNSLNFLIFFKQLKIRLVDNMIMLVRLAFIMDSLYSIESRAPVIPTPSCPPVSNDVRYHSSHPSYHYICIICIIIQSPFLPLYLYNLYYILPLHYISIICSLDTNLPVACSLFWDISIEFVIANIQWRIFSITNLRSNKQTMLQLNIRYMGSEVGSMFYGIWMCGSLNAARISRCLIIVCVE